MDSCMAKVSSSGLMDGDISGRILTMSKKVMEYFSGPMGESMRGNGKKAECTVEEGIETPSGRLLLEYGKTVVS